MQETDIDDPTSRARWFGSRLSCSIFFHRFFFPFRILAFMVFVDRLRLRSILRLRPAPGQTYQRTQRRLPHSRLRTDLSVQKGASLSCQVEVYVTKLPPSIVRACARVCGCVARGWRWMINTSQRRDMFTGSDSTEAT